jgi:hypothetical protein
MQAQPQERFDTHPNQDRPDMPSINDYYPSKFVTHPDLKGKPHVLTIAAVTRELVGQGPDQQRKCVIAFSGAEKKFICNKTNFSIIEDFLGPGDWVGKQIELFPDRTAFQGKQVPCIRIRAPRNTGGLAQSQQPVRQQSATPTAVSEPDFGDAPAAGLGNDIDDEIPF